MARIYPHQVFVLLSIVSSAYSFLSGGAQAQNRQSPVRSRMYKLRNAENELLNFFKRLQHNERSSSVERRTNEFKRKCESDCAVFTPEALVEDTTDLFTPDRSVGKTQTHNLAKTADSMLLNFQKFERNEGNQDGEMSLLDDALSDFARLSSDAASREASSSEVGQVNDGQNVFSERYNIPTELIRHMRSKLGSLYSPDGQTPDGIDIILKRSSAYYNTLISGLDDRQLDSDHVIDSKTEDFRDSSWNTISDDSASNGRLTDEDNKNGLTEVAWVAWQESEDGRALPLLLANVIPAQAGTEVNEPLAEGQTKEHGYRSDRKALTEAVFSKLSEESRQTDTPDLSVIKRLRFDHSNEENDFPEDVFPQLTGPKPSLGEKSVSGRLRLDLSDDVHDFSDDAISQFLESEISTSNRLRFHHLDDENDFPNNAFSQQAASRRSLGFPDDEYSQLTDMSVSNQVKFRDLFPQATLESRPPEMTSRGVTISNPLRRHHSHDGHNSPDSSVSTRLRSPDFPEDVFSQLTQSRPPLGDRAVIKRLRFDDSHKESNFPKDAFSQLAGKSVRKRLRYPDSSEHVFPLLLESRRREQTNHGVSVNKRERVHQSDSSGDVLSQLAESRKPLGFTPVSPDDVFYQLAKSDKLVSERLHFDFSDGGNNLPDVFRQLEESRQPLGDVSVSNLPRFHRSDDGNNLPDDVFSSFTESVSKRVRFPNTPEDALTQLITESKSPLGDNSVTKRLLLEDGNYFPDDAFLPFAESRPTVSQRLRFRYSDYPGVDLSQLAESRTLVGAVSVDKRLRFHHSDDGNDSPEATELTGLPEDAFSLLAESRSLLQDSMDASDDVFPQLSMESGPFLGDSLDAQDVFSPQLDMESRPPLRDNLDSPDDVFPQPTMASRPPLADVSASKRLSLEDENNFPEDAFPQLSESRPSSSKRLRFRYPDFPGDVQLTESSQSADDRGVSVSKHPRFPHSVDAPNDVFPQPTMESWPPLEDNLDAPDALISQPAKESTLSLEDDLDALGTFFPQLVMESKPSFEYNLNAPDSFFPQPQSRPPLRGISVSERPRFPHSHDAPDEVFSQLAMKSRPSLEDNPDVPDSFFSQPATPPLGDISASGRPRFPHSDDAPDEVFPQLAMESRPSLEDNPDAPDSFFSQPATTPPLGDISVSKRLRFQQHKQQQQQQTAAAGRKGRVFVYGQDDRLKVFLAQMRKFPFLNIARLSTGCTGTLVTPRHVLTAAHCVHTGLDFRENLEKLKIEIPDTMGFRDYYAQKITVPTGWVRGGGGGGGRVWGARGARGGRGGQQGGQHAVYDYAVVRLRLAVGGRTRFLPLAVPRPQVLQMDFHFLAFPQRDQRLWRSHCPASQHMALGDGNLIFTRCDAAVGNSGAAVFIRDPHQGGMRVVGVLSNTMHVAHHRSFLRYSIITALTWPKLTDICRELGSLGRAYNVCPPVRYMRRSAFTPPKVKPKAFVIFGKRGGGVGGGGGSGDGGGGGGGDGVRSSGAATSSPLRRHWVSPLQS